MNGKVDPAPSSSSIVNMAMALRGSRLLSVFDVSAEIGGVWCPVSNEVRACCRRREGGFCL